MAKALEPQLSRLLAADLSRSPAEGRGCLGQAAREDVQVQLLAACRGASVKPDPGEGGVCEGGVCEELTGGGPGRGVSVWRVGWRRVRATRGRAGRGR